MNLIEKLGGYEKAKSIYKNRPQTSTHHFNGKYYENWSVGKWVRFDGDQSVDCKKPDNGSVNLGILGLMLLEYRRQHNIFEVGDKVIGSKLFDDRIFEFQYYLPELSMAVISKDGAAIGLNQLRHATPEEIKAGKRLEVNDGST